MSLEIIFLWGIRNYHPNEDTELNNFNGVCKFVEKHILEFSVILHTDLKSNVV